MSDTNTVSFHIECVGDMDARKIHVVVQCKTCTEGVCRFPAWTGPAKEPMWHWDGDLMHPTITPSIHCLSCKRHFSITKGLVA